MIDSIETFFYLVPTIISIGLVVLVIDLYRIIRKYVVMKTRLTQAKLDKMESDQESKND
jgi:hypothetical protein